MNEQMLAYICEESTAHDVALIKAEFQADLQELYENELVQVEPDGLGNFRVAATEGGYKWIAASNKAPDVFVAPMTKANMAAVRVGGIPGIDEPAAAKIDSVMQDETIEADAKFPEGVVWDEPAPAEMIAAQAEINRQHESSATPSWANQAQEQPVWARPSQDGISMRQISQYVPGDGPMPREQPMSHDWAHQPTAAANPAPSPFQTHQISSMPFTPPPIPAAPIKPANPVVEVVRLPIPQTRKRGERKSTGIGLYPFDTMEAGTAFYIPPSPEHSLPHKSRAGLVTAANKKYSVAVVDANGQPVMVPHSFNRTVVDATGAIVFNPDGTKQTMLIESVIQQTRQTKKFAIYEAKRVPNQPHTTGAYIFRLE